MNPGDIRTGCFAVAAYAPAATSSVLIKLAGAGFREIPLGATGSRRVDRDREFTALFTAGGSPDGFVLLGNDNVRERYSRGGVLQFVSRPNGHATTLTYAPAARSWEAPRLVSATDSFGRMLSFQYDANGRVSGVVDPSGQITTYRYDEAPFACPSGNCGALTSVVFPDSGIKRYFYNEAEHAPSIGAGQILMTGLNDELGSRNGIYRYDANRRAISTEKAGGVERWSIDYGVPNQRRVTPPIGGDVVLRFNMVAGYLVQTGTDQPGGAGCGPASSSLTYDANANVTSRVDFSNRKTCYANDLSRNLETARVEGFTSSDTCPADAAMYTPAASTAQRKLLTQWHPDWRVETRKSEPQRITTSVYNGQPDPTAGGAITTCAPSTALVDGKPIAVLCKRVEQATSDETGAAGFAASAVGAARSETWTFNPYGQMLTHNGTRTDVSDLTTYEYYPDTQANWTLGDLKQITNPLGQITRFTKYDRNGRLLESIDANNRKTEHSYSPRGWLTQTKLTAPGGAIQTTTYEYDGVGQLLKATLPDASFVAYTYDAAHRLTQAADSAGNKVEYTIDAMGNRTAENWKDSSGTLRKTLTRVIDALNRVQTTSGGLQ